MPELPEVETVRRQLAPLIAGCVVLDAWSTDSPRFSDAGKAVGAVLGRPIRRGKYLLTGLQTSQPSGAASADPSPGAQPDPPPDTPPDSELVLHLGMTGRLATIPPEDLDAADAHLRAWWLLGDRDDRRSVLSFHDVRQFGRVAVVPAGDYRALPTLQQLGPEPLGDDFTPEGLRGSLSGRRPVKSVLLSQRAVAGVGNIYADEALWLAGVDPRSRRLGRRRAEVLVDSIRAVLHSALSDGGTTFRDYRDATGATGTHQHRLACYGRAGEPCPRCGTIMRRTVIEGRGTTWCPTCQH